MTRRGGLAGLTLSAELETDDRAGRALEQLAASQGPADPPHPDGFEYRFELPDGRVVIAPEQALPRELDPLLDEFAKKGKMPGA